MLRSLLFTALLFVLGCEAGFGQSITQKELLAKSRSYYEAKPYLYASAFVKTKSSIADDTATVIDECFIDKQKTGKLFLLPGDNGIFVFQSNQYFFFHQSEQYRKVANNNKKYTVYNTRYKHYPFVESDNFFNSLEQQNFALVKTDSSYILTNLSRLYEFKKENFAVSRVRNIEYDAHAKGTYFQEIRFDYPVVTDEDISAEINHAIEIVSSKNNQKEFRKESPKPVTIDRAWFNDAVATLHPNANIAGKTVLVDFFYEACLPCIKSYPVMNKFFECSNSSFAVIGIDPRLSDTLNIDKHIKRYDIKYPVMSGRIGEKLAEAFAVSGFPTFILIAPDGKIEVYRTGHSKSVFNMIKRKYVPNCSD